LLALTFAGLAVACSSKASSQEDDGDFQSAAQELAVSQNVIAPGEQVAATSSSVPAADPAYPLCHPHLFARSFLYTAALNYHVALFLGDMDLLLAGGPRMEGDTTRTWTYTGPAGNSAELTLTKSAPGVFSVAASVAAAGSSNFVTVVTGNVDRSNVQDIKKSFLFDLDKLHRVLPASAGDQSAGQFAIDIERTVSASGADRKRTVTYTLTNFVPVYGDPHGPRSGDIDFVEEPGVGGAMLYSTSLVFFCPDNPSNLSADSTVYARWYVSGSSGTATVAGRADALATGGQFASGDTWIGLTCRSVSLAQATADAGATVLDNGYWMMKEEASDGTTVVGSSIGDTQTGDPACDPALGAVTDLSDNANDPTLPATLPATGAFPGQF
jgi:hypothetical protein